MVGVHEHVVIVGVVVDDAVAQAREARQHRRLEVRERALHTPAAGGVVIALPTPQLSAGVLLLSSGPGLVETAPPFR